MTDPDTLGYWAELVVTGCSLDSPQAHRVNRRHGVTPDHLALPQNRRLYAAADEETPYRYDGRRARHIATLAGVEESYAMDLAAITPVLDDGAGHYARVLVEDAQRRALSSACATAHELLRTGKDRETVLDLLTAAMTPTEGDPR